MHRVIVILGIAGSFLLLLTLVLHAQAAPDVPLGRHCGDVGPLPGEDPDFCGCTWGEVLLHGQPVSGAVVTLTFNNRFVTGTTRLTPLEQQPYFDLTGHDLGARRRDVLTLTAYFAGQTITRTFRAWPEADGEQHIVLAFPERGIWTPWATGSYTRALVLSRDTVWAGGPEGLISINTTTSVSLVHTLPWANPAVRALAAGVDGHIWTIGPGGVAEFDGTTWYNHSVPLNGSPRAVVVNPTDGAVWVGGGDTLGSIAVYTGAWQVKGNFNAPVTALTADDDGHIWAGTWGDGVYRHNGSGGWTRYRETDGLASNWILSAVSGKGAVWFGTWPYLSGQGPRGGIARYDLETGTWRTYTTTHGLAIYALLPQAPAPVYALTVDEIGRPWAGTDDGLRFLADAEWWAAYTATHGLRTGPVMAVAAGHGTVIAASADGLERLDPDAVPGNPPIAQVVSAIPPTLSWGFTLTLTGTGYDQDESNERIVAWDWSSSLDGPLCTAAHCELPHSLFTPGIHSITLRLQDDEGIWSAPVTKTIAVEKVWQVYLPLILRNL